MTDRVLLSAGRNNIEACLELANSRGLGIEVMAFAFPDVLDGDWRAEVAWYKQALNGISPVTLHGPFFDLAPGSPDKRINSLVRDRYTQAIEIAAELDARLIVFHANFIGALKNASYRTGWQARNAVFWSDIAEFAYQHRMTVAVENMWEYDPTILTDLLAEVNSPLLRACLDVGHAHLFSDIPFEVWLNTLAPYLVHLHVNNNDGELDLHRAFPDGVLQYEEILTAIRALPIAPPTFTLEMDTVDQMERSLRYFDLAHPSSVSKPSPEIPGEASGKSDTAELPPVSINAE